MKYMIKKEMHALKKKFYVFKFMYASFILIYYIYKTL